MKKILAVSILIIVLICSFAGCSKTLDEQEIKQVLTDVRNSIDLENLDQIDISANGTVSMTETQNEIYETTTMKIEFIEQLLSKDNAISSQNLQIKMSTETVTNGEQVSGDLEVGDGSLIIESYYKDGNLYGYTNLLGDYYQYQEDAEAPTVDDSVESLPLEDVSLSEIDELIDMVMSDDFSKPTAVQKGKTITITWQLTIDDIKNLILQEQKDFEESFKEQYPDYELSTDEELMAAIDEELKGLKVDKLNIAITVEDKKLTGVSFEMDMTETSGEGEEAVTSTIKADFSLTVKTENVAVDFDNERLNEIKTKYEESLSNQ